MIFKSQPTVTNYTAQIISDRYIVMLITKQPLISYLLIFQSLTRGPYFKAKASSMASSDTGHPQSFTSMQEIGPQGRHKNLVKRSPAAMMSSVPIPLVDPVTKKNLFQTEMTSKLETLFSEAMAATNVKPKITLCQMIILAFKDSPYGENEEDLYGLATCTDIHDYIKKTFPYYRNSDLVFKKHLSRLLCVHKVFEKTHLVLDHQRVYWKINRSYYTQESTKTRRRISREYTQN